MSDSNISEFLIYKTLNNEIKIEVLLKNENIWLNQKKIAELFWIDRTVITKHLKNIFTSEELNEKTVCAKFAHTADDWKNYKTNFYNLDAIIAVWYRINSKQATQFRIWANQILKENIWLTNWKNSPDWPIRKNDVNVAKNYLNEKELSFLNRIVTVYLDYAELQAEKWILMTMKDWEKKLNAFLQFNEREILLWSWKITREVARVLQKMNMKTIELSKIEYTNQILID